MSQNLTFGLDVSGEECAWELDGTWCGNPPSEVLRCGSFHLVITEVVPLSGSADGKVEFISIKMTSGWPQLVSMHRF